MGQRLVRIVCIIPMIVFSTITDTISFTEIMQSPGRVKASKGRTQEGGVVPAVREPGGTRADRGTERSPLAEAFQALGSDARLRILKELLRGERSISELAGAVGLQPVTVRYHLNVLIGDGLVERTTSHGAGEVGRPPIRYRLRREGIIRGFPPRQYAMLAEMLLGIIEGSLGPAGRARALREAGKAVGQQLVGTLQREAGFSAWGPRRFARHYLGDGMARMGLLAVVADMGEDFVQYRSISCPFLELALKYPEMICDHLDAGFHEGVAARMGSGVIHERLACMGHGDAFCEQRLKWSMNRAEEG